MKKIIICICLFLTSSSLWASDEFKNPSTQSEFSELEKIENYVNTHPNTTLNDLKSKDSELLENINLLEETESVTTNMTKGMPIVGAFWWGCCLGVIGFALVYFMTDKDREQMRPAFWGCLISTVIFGIGGIINPFGW